MRKNEADPIRRRLPVTLENPDRTPYTGILTGPVIMLHVPGTTTWVPIAAQVLIGISGGHVGTFDIELAEPETAVAGYARYTVDVGDARPFEGYFEISDVGPPPSPVADVTLEQAMTWAVDGLHGSGVVTRQSTRATVRRSLTANWPIPPR